MNNRESSHTGKLYVTKPVFSIYINRLCAYYLILISPVVKIFFKDHGVGLLFQSPCNSLYEPFDLIPDNSAGWF
jgi:hypothetical protein